jgi:hypothetical protein
VISRDHAYWNLNIAVLCTISVIRPDYTTNRRHSACSTRGTSFLVLISIRPASCSWSFSLHPNSRRLLFAGDSLRELGCSEKDYDHGARRNDITRRKVVPDVLDGLIIFRLYVCNLWEPRITCYIWYRVFSTPGSFNLYSRRDPA